MPSAVSMFEERIDGTLAIHAAPADRIDKPLPTILFIQGFNTSSKEITSYFGYMLARVGFRVILPEADCHGERFDGDRVARLRKFWEIVKTTIDELPRIRDHYAAQGLIDADRVGVGGTSMGGFITLGSLVRYDWVRAAACYMGSGYFLDLSRTLNPPLGSFDARNQVEHDQLMSP